MYGGPGGGVAGLVVMPRPLPLVVGGTPHGAGMQGRRLQKQMKKILMGSSPNEIAKISQNPQEILEKITEMQI